MAGTNKMDIMAKKDFIKALKTKELIDSLDTQEKELQALREKELQFRSQNSQYITGRSADCTAVRNIKAELSMTAPMLDGKPMTEAQLTKWIASQEKTNTALLDAITKQREADFAAGDLEIQIKGAESKITSIRAIMALRTAQISFFAGDVLITINDPEIKQ